MLKPLAILNRENGNIKGINAAIYLFIYLVCIFNNNYKEFIQQWQRERFLFLINSELGNTLAVFPSEATVPKGFPPFLGEATNTQNISGENNSNGEIKVLSFIRGTSLLLLLI